MAPAKEVSAEAELESISITKREQRMTLEAFIVGKDGFGKKFVHYRRFTQCQVVF